KRGEIKPGDVLIEATSGNTGIALAMIAALKGYRMKLLMPDNMNMTKRINKDTQVCMSLAARPSNFGTRFHNYLYEALDLNYLYKA
ncbi:pyridoxal-phosphate dependent enzyme, partial [Salmonella enterica subsp. enterica serovar Montevideo]|nr:pyridoxal-phosphate dependent enzyme [Salmonella enterica subsp. enterica serovar Montevideo]